MRSLQRWFKERWATGSSRRPESRRRRPGLESLESRVVLYAATGNAWMNPEVITISFMPDGTNLGGATSNLISTFNNNPNLAGRWQQQFLQAAQAWAAETNINFVLVPDDGAPMGGGSYQEGDPGMGDIRIGGYNFGTSTLAWSYQPPSVNNYSLAGDIEINTGAVWNIGSTYDMFSVAAHEIGHALGLGESTTSPLDIMYPTYTGKKVGLAADDIAGIQSIYGGARAPDAYGGLNTTILTAANLDSLVNASTLTGLAYNLDLTTIGESEYFSVDVPTGATGPMQLSVQSQGLSLLSPKVTVYASNMTTVVGSASGLGQDGTTLNVTIPNAVAGQRYYVQVQGADSTVFSTGDYALGMSFNGTTPPVEPMPIISYPNGSPLHSGGGSAQQGNANGGLLGAPPNILGISPDNGASSSDGITDVNRIKISGIAPQGETITVYNNGTAVGTTVADSNGNWTFDNTGTALADGSYVFTATATDPAGNVSSLSLPYGVTIITTPPTAPALVGVTAGSMVGDTLTTTATKPILFGTGQPYSQVMVYYGTTLLGTTPVNGNGDWNFAYSTAGASYGTSYGIWVQAEDIAGNLSSPSPTFLVTVYQPSLLASAATVLSASLASSSILGVNPDGSYDTGTTTTFNGLATPGAQVAIFEDGVVIGVATAGITGSWSFTASGLTSGRHRLSFEAVNTNGVLGSVIDSLILDA